ncbi:MAG: 16S rRNA (guanine(527)-N(7))-methyltransferase RsmG [Oscillospiraceae bacterium]|nr:16S rRNA (guanine(527)-N(7))-methyltransferase RsmG [Oscillospiraceae bacterium]
MSDVILQIIEQGAKELNIELPPAVGAAFEAYADFLSLHGRHTNLTAISDAEEIARLHFLDSLALLCIGGEGETLFDNATVIDIGSGAGFPGIPLKLALPTISLTVLDAARKKTDFLSELCARLKISATCVHARAEIASHDLSMRDSFDICVSRAVAKLNILCELCLPFVQVGGLFVAMKSVRSDGEIEAAQNAINLLGGELYKIFDYLIPGTDITHRAVLVRKKTATPDGYPRKFAKLRKAPL